MTKAELGKEVFAPFPSLVGYAYKAEVLCAGCAKKAFAAIPAAECPRDTDDPRFTDSDSVPQPFSEASPEGEWCGRCGECLSDPEDADESDLEE